MIEEAEAERRPALFDDEGDEIDFAPEDGGGEVLLMNGHPVARRAKPGTSWICLEPGLTVVESATGVRLIWERSTTQ